MNRFFACRCWWLVAILLCAVALGLLLIQPGEPAYGGRKLSAWVTDVPAPSYSYDDPDDSNAVHAIQQIGTNALPFLLRQLQTRESPLRSFRLWLKTNQSLVSISTKTAERVRFDASLAVGVLGPAAEPALPELTRLLHRTEFAPDVAPILPFVGRNGYLALSTGLTNSNPEVRRYSAGNLVLYEARPLKNATNEAVLKYRREAVVAIPALLHALGDTDPKVLRVVITALGHIRQEPQRVVPALEKFLVDTRSRADFYKSPRYAAEAALKMFGSNAVASEAKDSSVIPFPAPP